jgi:very-short-patch-repair endonuclease
LYIKNRQLNGVKFRRQRALGNYIVDFVSFEENLIIEIDGGQHNDNQTIEKDRERTGWLNTKGFRIIRFWNNDVLENIEGVMNKITEELTTCSHPHLTSPIKGEEE